MAGTGLPLPKRRGNTSQPNRLTPQINAARWSTADDWGLVAQAGRQLAGVGFGLAEDAQREAKREELEARAGYMAEQENEIAAKRIELADKHHLDPEGFKAAWGAYADSKQAGAETWARPGLTKALGGSYASAYSTILNQKRAQDHKLNADRVTTMITRDGDDVVGTAMAGQMGTPDWDAKVAKLQHSLDSAVNLKLMPQEKADEIRDDVASRAHGEVATRTALDVYREKGREAAIAHLRSSILENTASSLSPTQKQAVYNKGLSAIELQRQVDGQDRAEFVSAAQDMIKGLDAGQTLDPVHVSTIADGLKRTGAVGTLLRLQSQIAIKNATAPFANLAPADALGHLDRLESRGASIGPQLAMAESGGRPDAVNQFGYAGRYQFGAPRLADLGFYKPGAGESLAEWSKSGRDAPGKWTGEFNIPGFPEVKTLQDFLGSPKAQEAVMQAQVQKANQEIDARGMDRFIGQTVGGTVVTRAGLQAMIHLGGPGSAQAFLESGGNSNPADANGRTVGDYLKLGETGTDRVLPYGGAVTKAIQDEFVKQVRKDWPEIKAQIEKGEVADPKALMAMVRAADMSGDGGWKREVQALVAAQRGNQALQGMTVAQGQEGIEALEREFRQDGSMSVDEQRVIDSLRQAFRLKLKQVTEDPVAYALSKGATQPQPLNFADPAAARTAVAERVNLARGVAEANRVAPGSPFGEADRQTIAGAIAGPDPKQAQVAMDSLFALPDAMLVPALGPEVRSAIQGAARSTDGAKYGAAMAFLDKMWARAPETTAKLFGDDAMDAMQAWQQQLRYATPEQLTEQRMKALDPQVRARQKDLEADGRKEARKTKPEDIAGAFDESILPFTSPAAPTDENTRNAFMGDYDVLFSRAYAQTMDKDKAQQMAVERMKTKWGVSGLNGGRLMLNAPERHYPAVDGSHDWMKAELEAGLAQQVGKPMIEPDPNVPGGTMQNWTYELVADRTTQSEVAQGLLPSYAVLVTKDGRGDLMPRRVRWSTDAVTQAEDRWKAERERQESVRRMYQRNDEAAAERQARTNAYIQSRR